MNKPIVCLITLLLLFNIASSQSFVKDIKNKGVSIAYTDKGTGATTLLFVHGWAIDKSYWDSQIKYFSKQYRVVAIDLPGFGQSGKNRSDWSVSAYAGDVIAVINQLHLKNVILIGHSMSGNIVAQAAVSSSKVIGVVGVDTFRGFGKGSDPKDKADIDRAFKDFKADFKGVALQFANQMFYNVSDSITRKRVIYDYVHADPVIGIASLEQGESCDDKLLATQLKEKNLKVYLINSDADLTDISGFRTVGLPYQLLLIHATGHFPMIEKPADFNAALAKAADEIVIASAVKK